MSNGSSKRPRPEVSTPSNAITVLRILLVPVFVASLLTPWPDWIGLASNYSDDWKSIVATVVFVIISGTDWLDGYLARSRNEVTDFGKFMDPLADKILVASALICLVELGDLPTWVVLIILAREFIVSGVRMMAASKGMVIAASMVGKFKTVFQMIAIVLFTLKRSTLITSLSPGFNVVFWYVSWGFMLVALVLTIASMVDYLSKSRDLIGLGKAAFDPTATADAPIDKNGLYESISEEAVKVVNAAKRQSVTIATAESLTGGMIGSALTSVPGSSNVFKGGIVSYTNEVKRNVLNVNSESLKTSGAVSDTVARQMAEGAVKCLDARIGVAVTGLAGPDADEFGNPVGTVFIAVSADGATECHEMHFEGDRSLVRLKTVEYSLEQLESVLREIR